MFVFEHNSSLIALLSARLPAGRQELSLRMHENFKARSAEIFVHLMSRDEGMYSAIGVRCSVIGHSSIITREVE